MINGEKKLEKRVMGKVKRHACGKKEKEGGEQEGKRLKKESECSRNRITRGENPIENDIEVMKGTAQTA